MPELPETETIARDLDGALRGAVVRSVQVVRRDVLRGDPRARPRPAPAALAASLATELTGATVHRVSRHAKSVVLAFGTVCLDRAVDGLSRLVVTPRFTGALLLGGAPDDAYTCLRLDLADGRVLRYHDVRRLGTLTLLGPLAFEAWESSHGPEPLDPALTVERFSGIIRGSSRAVKSVLMDQKRLAGVGNIYANEALWRARIRPSRRGRTVTRAACATLLAELQAVLRESIALRGTTFRDYRDAFGARGGFAARLQVYGRAGLSCVRCGRALSASHAIGGRQTVWCTECQR